MQLHLTHETRYRYSPAVENAHHVAHLQPAHSALQTLHEHHLHISPEPAERRDVQDSFGNHTTYFSLHAGHASLSVTAQSRVSTGAPALPGSSAPWERVAEAFRYQAGAAFHPAWEFVFASTFAPKHDVFAQFALPSFTLGLPIHLAAHALMTSIYSAMRFDPDSTEVNTQPLVALRQGSGVCQDFAHIMVACCRALGLPARYVSGYLLTEPAEGQPRLVGCDASHAWASVWCPADDHARSGTGQWLDFDPTNNRAPGEDYITLAIGRDFLDVSPLRGVIRGGAQHILDVAVTVTPLD